MTGACPSGDTLPWDGFSAMATGCLSSCARVGGHGEHDAEISLARAVIRSSDEAYSSRSRMNDALRS
jgi:hypothetical protein